MPDAVAGAFAAMPEAVRGQALALRAFVFDAAREAGLQRPSETLKWGEPAYLPGKDGTTGRIGLDQKTGGLKVLVNCQTSLVEGWRERFGDRLRFEGNRAVLIPSDGVYDSNALRVCVQDALTYHAAQRTRHG